MTYTIWPTCWIRRQTLQAIDDAMAENALCVITFHSLVDSSPAPRGERLVSSHETIIDHIVTQGYTVKSFSEFIDELG